MTVALDRIIKDFSEFSEGVDRCRHAKTFNAADHKDAYNRLSRLRDRYLHEKQNHTLDSTEEGALRKVFEEDPFIEGMLDSRQIGEHVQKTSGSGPVIRLRTNEPIPLCVETSAGSLFDGATTTVRDAQGKFHYVDHLAQLTEAEQRIQRALARATNKP